MQQWFLQQVFFVSISLLGSVYIQAASSSSAAASSSRVGVPSLSALAARAMKKIPESVDVYNVEPILASAQKLSPALRQRFAWSLVDENCARSLGPRSGVIYRESTTYGRITTEKFPEKMIVNDRHTQVLCVPDNDETKSLLVTFHPLNQFSRSYGGVRKDGEHYTFIQGVVDRKESEFIPGEVRWRYAHPSRKHMVTVACGQDKDGETVERTFSAGFAIGSISLLPKMGAVCLRESSVLSWTRARRAEIQDIETGETLLDVSNLSFDLVCAPTNRDLYFIGTDGLTSLSIDPDACLVAQAFANSFKALARFFAANNIGKIKEEAHSLRDYKPVYAEYMKPYRECIASAAFRLLSLNDKKYVAKAIAKCSFYSPIGCRKDAHLGKSSRESLLAPFISTHLTKYFDGVDNLLSIHKGVMYAIDDCIEAERRAEAIEVADEIF